MTAVRVLPSLLYQEKTMADQKRKADQFRAFQSARTSSPM
jgi:hypothetical protein